MIIIVNLFLINELVAIFDYFDYPILI